MNLWKEYSLSYLKNNRVSSISVITAAFISSTLLSLICGVYYNIWTDNVRLAKLQGIDWRDKYGMISSDGRITIPPVLFVYLFTLIIACFSLILIIHNAFEVTMNTRLHQLGIIQSLGASPRQIRSALVNEALMLCILPILAGDMVGIGLCYAFMEYMKRIAQTVREYELIFHYHPLILLVTLIASIITIWYSARIPARKLSRIKPLEAIRNGGEHSIHKMKGFFILSHLFGIEGELARKSLYARRKAFRTSTLSLTLSFLVFSGFLNMEKFSDISTQYTYYERYKDRWDLMVSTEMVKVDKGELLSVIRTIDGVSRCISYQRGTAYTHITDEMLSEELVTLGGLAALKDKDIQTLDDMYQIEVPLIFLDSESFDQYCSKIKVNHELFTNKDKPAGILINTIWDNIHSDRLHRNMIPFINASKLDTLKLYTVNSPKLDAELSSVRVAAATDTLPELKEEYPNYSLILVMPEYANSDITSFMDPSSYYSIKANSDDRVTEVENAIKEQLGSETNYILENRLVKEQNNNSIRNAYKTVIGALAGLLACIGLANVFSNSLGHIYQRKKEFARYLSLGLSPKGVVKVLAIEAMVLGFRPILFGLIINIPLILYGVNASYIGLDEFIAQMPIGPITIFAAVIMASIGLCYYIGGRNICKSNLIKTLKEDIMI